MFNLILGSFSLSFARINLFPVENSSDVGKDRYNDVFLYAVVLIFVKFLKMCCGIIKFDKISHERMKWNFKGISMML